MQFSWSFLMVFQYGNSRPVSSGPLLGCLIDVLAFCLSGITWAKEMQNSVIRTIHLPPVRPSVHPSIHFSSDPPLPPGSSSFFGLLESPSFSVSLLPDSSLVLPIWSNLAANSTIHTLFATMMARIIYGSTGRQMEYVAISSILLWQLVFPILGTYRRPRRNWCSSIIRRISWQKLICMFQ